MKIANVYRQPSNPPNIYRFEFTNVKPMYSSFIISNNKLYASTAHTLHRYPFLTKVIPYENITK
jgi:hypothetical protein